MNDEIVLTAASLIEIRPAKWLWDQRLPLGELSLLAGREGVGKSTFDCWLAAGVSTGTLPGESFGVPRNVLMIATEDDWSTTIAPRLLAAGADLSRVFKVSVAHPDTKRESQIHLPVHFEHLEEALRQTNPALVIFSPLVSRLSEKLDSHKDQEVRQALEPLVEIAERFSCSILGLIHLNKAGGTDPLRAVMGSAAFVAIARAVLFMQRDPDDGEIRVVGQPKNNLGMTDYELGLLTFSIESVLVGHSPDGEPVSATRLVWGDDRAGTIEQILDEANTSTETRTVIAEAADWLKDHLTAAGGFASCEAINKAGSDAGFNERTLKRARAKIGAITQRSQAFPRTSSWILPGALVAPTIIMQAHVSPPPTPRLTKQNNGHDGHNGHNSHDSQDRWDSQDTRGKTVLTKPRTRKKPGSAGQRRTRMTARELLDLPLEVES